MKHIHRKITIASLKYIELVIATCDSQVRIAKTPPSDVDALANNDDTRSQCGDSAGGKFKRADFSVSTDLKSLVLRLWPIGALNTGSSIHLFDHRFTCQA